MVGPWTHTAPRIAAFDAQTDPLESRWRIDLARDDAASRAEFAAGERSVARTHAVLDDVPRRLDRALGRAVTELAALAELAKAPKATRPARPAPARGDPRRAAAPELAPVEADLVAALAHADPHRPPIDPPGMLGSSLDEPGRLEQTLEHTLGRVADLARGRARIETHASGALVAHSIMTLSGDTELWTVPRLSLADARLHARSVAVAVRTRHAWARILTLVIAGCGRILTLGLPAAGVSALPLVWRFVRDLLREVRGLNAAPRPAA
jgi:hypothetical protein